MGTTHRLLFAGHDEGAKSSATIASLIEATKLNGVEPFAWLNQAPEMNTQDARLYRENRTDQLNTPLASGGYATGLTGQAFEFLAARTRAQSL